MQLIEADDPALRLPTTPVTRYVVGLDLGQSADYTAVAVLGWNCTPDVAKPVYQVGHLERFPLGTKYPDIVRSVAELCRRPEMAGNWQLVPDATGVGRPVVDMFREALSEYPRRVHPITITGGSSASSSAVGTHVPKRDLVVTLKVLLESQRIEFAGRWPETADLIRETLAFQVKITNAANDTYGAWREGTHDDLVLAVAMAAWYAERKGQPKVARSRQG
jgi:hypothetical protein